MNRLLVSAIAIFLIVSGCVSPPKYDSVFYDYTSKVEYTTTVRIAVICKYADSPSKWGSGTGFLTWNGYVLTAKHLSQCNPKGYIIFVRNENEAAAYPAQVDKMSETADVMKLKIISPDAWVRNVSAADISRVKVKIGQPVCSVGGDYIDSGWIRKCGEVVGTRSDMIVVSVQAVPGNSGSPLFDVHGRIIGILVAGTWNASAEKTALVVPVYAWEDLLRI